MMILNSTYFPKSDMVSFFSITSVDGHLGCFQRLAPVNHITVNMGIHGSLQFDAITLKGTSRRSRVGSNGISVSSFMGVPY